MVKAKLQKRVAAKASNNRIAEIDISFMDKTADGSLHIGGLDVWMERPGYGEPARHLSLAVGDPNGDSPGGQIRSLVGSSLDKWVEARPCP